MADVFYPRSPDRAMTIVHLITGLQCGGAENQLVQLLLASDRRDFRHVVIALLPGGVIADTLQAAGIEVHFLGMKRGIPSPGALLRLTRLFRRLRPDIIHCWLYHACLMGVLAGCLVGSPRMIWGIRAAHGELRDYSRLTRSVVRLCARLSWVPDLIILNSETARAVHLRLGYKAARMRVIKNGVDPNRFFPVGGARIAVREELRIRESSFLIGIMARFDPMKDHHTFLRAAALVHQRHPDIHFVLAGDDVTADNPILVRLLNQYGLCDAVHLLGRRLDLPKLMSALDVACLSSWSESFPNVVPEAMACSIPCVVTNVGDVASIVGNTGKIVQPRSPLELANGLNALITMPAPDRTALGKKARERILDEFTLEKTIKAYEEVYVTHSERSCKCSANGNAFPMRFE